MKRGTDSFVPNPVLGGLVGVFPLAVAANSLMNGLVLGIGSAFCSAMLASLLPALRAVAPERLRAPLSLGIAAALALLYTDIVLALAPVVAAGLGVYLPLLAVNCMSLHILRSGPAAQGRYGSAASRMGIVFREAFGYLLVALLVGALRELAGSGSLVLPAVLSVGAGIQLTAEPPLRFLVSPAGGFILIGCGVALYRVLLRGAGRRIP
ncbi:MAG TPA: Rnf-Nqr domain containing protein [Rectinemataceae bacterium]|nr:Rnf-Nqr domain containing protein [Rectinemataceae bacterium]